MSENGVEPSNRLIAEKLGVTEYEVSSALDSLKEPKSLYEPIYNDGGDTIYLCDQISNKRDDYDLDYRLALEKANIIGIYRTDKYKWSSENNTFDYLVGIGNQESHMVGDELKSSTTKITSKKDKNVKKELPYIDLIAIVQDLEINGGDIDE